MSITNLFCTPEQGRRLAELVQELKYHFEWAGSISGKWSMFPKVRGFWVDLVDLAPALTLQELVVLMHDLAAIEAYELGSKIYNMTAPELAQWIIERIDYGQSV